MKIHTNIKNCNKKEINNVKLLLFVGQGGVMLKSIFTLIKNVKVC